MSQVGGATAIYPNVVNTGENLVRRELGKEGERNKRRERKGRKAGWGETTTRKWRKKNNIHVCIYMCVCYITHALTKSNQITYILKFSIKCKGLH